MGGQCGQWFSCVHVHVHELLLSLTRSWLYMNSPAPDIAVSHSSGHVSLVHVGDSDLEVCDGVH